MAEQDTTPVFQIQRVYLKDLSLEQPNSPRILMEQAQPQVEINLGVAAEGVAEGIFEVTVTATVTTKAGDKTVFLVEAKQAGIFEIRNVPAEQLQPVIGIACPGIVYPYLRASVADVITRAHSSVSWRGAMLAARAVPQAPAPRTETFIAAARRRGGTRPLRPWSGSASRRCRWPRRPAGPAAAPRTSPGS